MYIKSDTLKKLALVSIFAANALVLPVVAAETAADTGRPLIGINMDVKGGTPVSYRILPDYVNAIRNAGGMPVVLPPTPEAEIPELLSHLDGVLMIGGNDYPPELYGEETHKSVVKMEDERTQFDLALTRAVLKNKRVPFLGICAGCQVLNIASGGSLTQDIPSQVKDPVLHASPDGWTAGFNKHVVQVEPDSKIAKIMNKAELEVVTSHHQCVNKVGKDLKVAARAKDGVIESVESTDKNFAVGVQWHPERDFKNNQALFVEFVNKGKQARKERLESEASRMQLSTRQ